MLQQCDASISQLQRDVDTARVEGKSCPLSFCFFVVLF
jgi:hypothetical protein